MLASAVSCFSHVTALGLSLYCLRNGLVTSGLIFYDWTLLLFAGGITFKSAIKSSYGGIIHVTISAIWWYPLVVAMFFLNCWADAKPRIINLDGKLFFWYPKIKLSKNEKLNGKSLKSLDQDENMTPEKYASHLSKIVFGWVDPLTWKGWRTTLDQSMLWSLMRENRSVQTRTRQPVLFVTCLIFNQMLQHIY